MRRSVAILAFGVFVLTADTALSQTATSTDRLPERLRRGIGAKDLVTSRPPDSSPAGLEGAGSE